MDQKIKNTNRWLDKYDFSKKKDGGEIAQDGVIKQTEPWYRQIPNNVAGWWEHNKPQLMKDFPITDFSIGPTLDYLAGKGGEESALAILPSIAKIKPQIFKPNSEAYYRVIGDDIGYMDAINSGVIRPNQSGIFKGRQTYYTKGAINDINNTVSGGAKRGTYYKGDYIVEVLPNNTNFPKQTKGLNPEWNFGSTMPGEEIPINSDFVNIYKKTKNGYIKVDKKISFRNGGEDKFNLNYIDTDIIPKYKNGGVIKDDNGYWNPDNWGKPVEIDSNDITMEGVYQNLLGISDVGDVRIMHPGEHHKFKGEKVREYPIAQTGITTGKSFQDDLAEGLTDTGTRLLHAISSFGGSVIGDAVKGATDLIGLNGDQAAEWLEKYSAGLIPYTSQEMLEANRPDNSNKWSNRLGQTSGAITNVALGEMMGVGMQKAAPYIAKGANATVDFVKNVPENYAKVIEAAAKDELYKVNPFASKLDPTKAFAPISETKAQTILDNGLIYRGTKPGEAVHYIPKYNEAGIIETFVPKFEKDIYGKSSVNDGAIVDVTFGNGKKIKMSIGDIKNGKLAKYKNVKYELNGKQLPTNLKTRQPIFKDEPTVPYSGVSSPDIKYKVGEVPDYSQFGISNKYIIEADPNQLVKGPYRKPGAKGAGYPFKIDTRPLQSGDWGIPLNSITKGEYQTLGNKNRMLQLDPVWGYKEVVDPEKLLTGSEPSSLSQRILGVDRFLKHPMETIGNKMTSARARKSTAVTNMIENSPKGIRDILDFTIGDLRRPGQKAEQANRILNHLEDKAWKAERAYLDKTYNVERKWNDVLANRPAVDLDARAKQWGLQAHKKDIEGITSTVDGLIRPESGGLQSATNIGKKEVMDFQTKKPVVAKVDVPGEGELFKLKKEKGKNKLVADTYSPGELSVNDEYIQTQKRNINHVETSIPGTKVYGSSVGVAEGNLPHITNDIDAFISESNYNKHVKNKYQLYSDPKKPVDVKNVKQHTFDPELGDSGVIDFNIVFENKSTGKATGKRAEELYKFIDPDGFYKASRKAYTTKSNIEIPYTADELIAKTDPTVKTITDAYQSIKPKHINRIDTYISYGRPDKVLQAQEKYLHSIVGTKGTLGHQFDKMQLSDPDINRAILREINFIGDNATVAKSPERMQIALNDFYINNSVLSRAVNGDDLAVAEAALKHWKDQGGQAMGAGQNHVTAGDSHYPGHKFYGNKQLGLQHDVSDPLKYVDNIKRQTDGTYLYTPEEKMQVRDILKKYDINSSQYPIPENPGQMIRAAAYYPKAKEALAEIGDVTGRRAVKYETFGDSYYSSTMKDFDDLLDILEFTTQHDMTKPKSTRLREENFYNSVYKKSINKDDFYKIKNLLDGGIAKAEYRLKRAEYIEREFKHSLDVRKNDNIQKLPSVLEQQKELQKIRAIRNKAIFQKQQLEKRADRLLSLKVVMDVTTRLAGSLGAIGYGISKIPESKSGKRRRERNKEWIKRRDTRAKINNQKADASLATPEYKDGGQLQKIDQLINFTNYNKPQSGGWLSKYE